MNVRNSTERYGMLSVNLHWLMVLLLIAVYCCMELREFFPKGSDARSAMKTWHYMLGLSVFALAGLRLLVRAFGAVPGIDPPPPRWQLRSASLMHGALYALMIAMPLLGWLMLSADATPVPFFGLQLPPLVAKSKALAGQVEEWHEIGAIAGYFLVGLHACAGLYHHYVVRDNTLRRMLPTLR